MTTSHRPSPASGHAPRALACGATLALLLTAACGGGGGSTPTTSAPTVTAPAITTQPVGTTVVAGATATFTVAATGTSPAYQWKKGATVLGGATSASYTTPATFAADDNSSFTVTVSNSAGSVTSSATTLRVNYVTLGTQPQNSSITTGGTANFSVTASGSTGGTLSYQWAKDGSPISGATSATYATPSLDMSDNGASYSCTVSNDLNGTTATATSTAASVTVNPASFFASAQTVSKGEGVVFTYLLNGSDTATLSDGTTTNPVVSGGSTVVYPTTSTTYTLAVTTGAGTFPITIPVTVKTYTPKNVYLVNNGDNNVSRYTVAMSDPNGKYVKGDNSGNALQSLATGQGPIHAVDALSGKFLYVANNGGNSLSAYSLDATTGAMTAVAGSPFALSASTAPWCSAVDPSGSHLYVACAEGIEVFAINAATGVLTAQPSLTAPIAGRVKGDILIHPSGRFLLVADNGNSVVKTYGIDATTGALTFVGDQAVTIDLTNATQVSGPLDLTFDRAGTRVFTRASTDDANNAVVYAFNVDPYTGALSAQNSLTGNGDPLGWGQMNNVRGLDGHHSLAYSRQPGQDHLYNAYSGENTFATSLSDYLVAADGSMTDTSNTTGSIYGSPFSFLAGFVFLPSAGDSVVVDRSGQLIIITDSTDYMLWPYATDANGQLSAHVDGMGAQYSLYTGAMPFHVCITGTLQ